VILIGSPEARARLERELPDGVVVAGEAPTLASARESDVDADAWLLASPRRRAPAVHEVQEALTTREVEVLELLAQGLPNKDIAARLAISDQTVKFHVASIYGKLHAANRTDAVRRAWRRGLISL
jgi:DNA-binding NarL/FixJ family response regulator